MRINKWLLAFFTLIVVDADSEDTIDVTIEDSVKNEANIQDDTMLSSIQLEVDKMIGEEVSHVSPLLDHKSKRRASSKDVNV